MEDLNFNKAKIEKFVESIRPKEEIRDQIDTGFTYENDTFELFEIRPAFFDPEIKVNSPIAKARYIKSKQIWKIYWMPGSMKWTAYTPKPEVKTIEGVFEEIKADEKHCFWG